jgi:L-ribulose-5-phosphate 3-epimerase
MKANRREFLVATGTAAAFASMGAIGVAAESASRKRPLRKGYMLQTFPGGKNKPPTLLEQFKLLQEAGFAGVEPRSHLDQDEILAARDATGLAIASVSCGAQSRLLANASPATRQQGVAGIQQALRDAKRYGAKSILVVPGVVSETVTYDQNYRWVQEGVRACVPLAEELGVVMALENVWNNFLLSPLEAARFVDEFQSKAVGWHFDVGNIVWMAWPEQWIRILGKRIAALHIKEYSRKKQNDEGKRKGFDVEYLEGDNNWPAVMKALDEVGYQGWAIAEPAWRPEGVAPLERLREISRRMDRILAA